MTENGAGARRDDQRLDMLIEAGLTLASELDLEAMLGRIVELAVAITGARYGALGVSVGRAAYRAVHHPGPIG